MQTSLGAGFRSVANHADKALKAGNNVRRSRSERRSHDGRKSSIEIDLTPYRDSRGHARDAHDQRGSASPEKERFRHDYSLRSTFKALVHESFGSRLDAEPSGTSGPGRAWFYPELPWGAPPGWQKVPLPGKTFLMYWDVILFFACIYVSIMVPYLVGFVDPANFLGTSDQDTCAFNRFGKDLFRTAIVSADIAVDSIFVLDMLISFHLAQWVICREGRLHHLLIDDLPTIRSMYLRGSFMIDALGIIPWQYADCLRNESELKILRLLRLMKMLRLYRVDRMIQTLYFKYPKSVFVVTIFQLLLYMFMCAHIMCCIFFFVGYGDPQGWVIADEWMAENLALRPDDLSFAWISSFYWAIATMTTIGYGDISANTEAERYASVLCMLIGAGFFAWSCGKMTRALTDSSQCVVRFKDKWEEIEEFLNANNIPEHLTDKIRSFYMLKFPLSRIYDEDAIMNDLPVGLRKEMAVELFADVLETVPLFRFLKKSTIMEICDRLHPIFQTLGLDITFEGEDPDALYIVRFGTVTVFLADEEVMEATRGDIIGENGILGLTLDGRRNRRCVAKTSCELCRLSTVDFMELLRKCKDLQRRCRLLVGVHLKDLEESIKQVAWKKAAAKLDVANELATNQSWRAKSKGTSPEIMHKWESVTHNQEEDSDRLSMLTTRISIKVKGLIPAVNTVGHDASWQHYFRFCNIKYAVLGMQYQDNNDRKEIRSRHFSQVFPMNPDMDGLVTVNEEISLEIRHSITDWRKLTPIRVGLYAVSYPDCFVAPDGYLPHLDDPLPEHEPQPDQLADLSPTENERSHIVTTASRQMDDLQLVAVGSMPLKTLVQEREQYGHRKNLTFRLNKIGGDLSNALDIICRTNVNRRLPPASPWRRVLRRIKAQHMSHFFGTETLKAVQNHKVRFDSLMRDISSAHSRQKPFSHENEADTLSDVKVLLKGLYSSTNHTLNRVKDLQASMQNMQVTMDDVQTRLRSQELRLQGKSSVGANASEVTKQVEYPIRSVVACDEKVIQQAGTNVLAAQTSIENAMQITTLPPTQNLESARSLEARIQHATSEEDGMKDNTASAGTPTQENLTELRQVWTKVIPGNRKSSGSVVSSPRDWVGGWDSFGAASPLDYSSSSLSPRALHRMPGADSTFALRSRLDRMWIDTHRAPAQAETGEA